jgi:hypothetical protein
MNFELNKSKGISRKRENTLCEFASWGRERERDVLLLGSGLNCNWVNRSECRTPYLQGPGPEEEGNLR